MTNKEPKLSGDDFRKHWYGGSNVTGPIPLCEHGDQALKSDEEYEKKGVSGHINRTGDEPRSKQPRSKQPRSNGGQVVGVLL